MKSGNSGHGGAILLLALPVLCFAARAQQPRTTQDVLTWHNDNARTGQALGETILTPNNVNAQSFGKLFVIPVDGKVDAEPLYAAGVELPNRGLHNVLFVATEHDTLYAFDADTGTRLWQVRLLRPGETPSDQRGCSQIVPEIGITSTPVIDRSRGKDGVIYAISMSKDAQGQYFQRLHALDLGTGAEQSGGPVDVSASFPGNGAASRGGIAIFDPKQYAERSALLLLNGTLYTSWTSHCDHDPYNGWIMGYDAGTLKQTSVLDITPNGDEGGIWQSGAGPAADPQNFIYLLSGNGAFDTRLNAKGFPAQGDFGNSFLKLSTAGRRLSVADYFTMYNVKAENDADEDVGSGGALVLPEMRDAAGKSWSLAVGAGKDRNIYLVNRESMGRFDPQGNKRIYQELPLGLKGQTVRSSPAYFNGRLYYGSVGDSMREFRFTDARLAETPASVTAIKFGYPGTTPSISADGSKNGIVWAVENRRSAVLHAYDASDLSHELYNSNQAASGRDRFGAGNKFITPMIARGKVYVGTEDGVGVFGLLPQSGAAASQPQQPPQQRAQ